MDSEIKEILLVDDDPFMLEALKRCLRRDFSVQTNLNPEDALDVILRGRHYAVVMADIHMPHMNGIDFLTRVAEISPTTVRIAMTGMIQLETRRAALEKAKVFRFLTKPCCTHLVIDSLYEALEAHRRNCLKVELSSDGTDVRFDEFGQPYDAVSKKPLEIAVTTPAPSDPPFANHSLPRYLLRRA